MRRSKSHALIDGRSERTALRAKSTSVAGNEAETPYKRHLMQHNSVNDDVCNRYLNNPSHRADARANEQRPIA